LTGHFSMKSINPSINLHLKQRCPTLSPIATCGDRHFKCGDRHNFCNFYIFSSIIFKILMAKIFLQSLLKDKIIIRIQFSGLCSNDWTQLFWHFVTFQCNNDDFNNFWKMWRQSSLCRHICDKSFLNVGQRWPRAYSKV